MQEFEGVYVVELVVVVGYDGCVGIFEIEEGCYLVMNFVNLGGNYVRCVQFVFGGFEVWVVDYVGGVVDQCDWFVVGFLEVFENQYWYQMVEVQVVSCWIEIVIQCYRFFSQ